MNENNNHDDELLQQARKRGLSYNEAIEWMTKNTGGYNTDAFSDTDTKAVKELNRQSKNNISPKQ